MKGSKHPIVGRKSSHTISLSKTTVTFLSVYAGKKKKKGVTDKQIKKNITLHVRISMRKNINVTFIFYKNH